MRVSARRERTFRRKPTPIAMARSNIRSGWLVMRALPAPRKRASPKIAEACSTDLLQALFEARSVGDVEFCSTSHCRHLGWFKRADHPRWRADDQGVLGKLLAFGNHRTGTDDAAAANSCTVHDNRTHSDQRAIFQGAAVQDDVVADRAILS